MAGVQFTAGWGVEYNYVDLGERTLNGTVDVATFFAGPPPTVGTTTIPYSATISSSSGVAAVTCRHTLNDRFTLVAKAGGYDMDTKASGSLFPTRLSLGGTHLFAELGASYQVNPRLAWVGEASFFLGPDKNMLFSTGPRFVF